MNKLAIFLNKYKTVATALIVVSFLLAALVALLSCAFCDVGPISVCIRTAKIAISIPFFQLFFFLIGRYLLSKEKENLILASGIFMLISLLPLLLVFAGFIFLQIVSLLPQI